jgi:hypothetical protein
MHQVCGIGETSVNVIFRQLRIVINNLRFRHAFSQAVENHGNLNAGVANAGPATTYVGFGSNPYHQFMSCHPLTFWSRRHCLSLPKYLLAEIENSGTPEEQIEFVAKPLVPYNKNQGSLFE